MDLSLIYSKTSKGMRVLAGKSRALPSNLMRALSLIDGKSTVSAILAQSDNFTEQELSLAFTQLENEGYLKVLKTSDPDLLWQEQETFSTMEVSEVSVEEFLKIKSESEGRGREEAAAQAEKEAEAKEAAARKIREAAEIKAREDAERRVREEVEAKVKTEAERKAKEAAEAHARAEAERVAKEYAERRAREETAAKAREDVERRAREEAEAERKAREEAEAQAAAERRAREEAEARAQAEHEAREEAAAKAREDAERKAKEETKARVKAEAERKAKDLAQARAQATAERKARKAAEAERKHEARMQATAGMREQPRSKLRIPRIDMRKLARIATALTVSAVVLLLFALYFVNLGGLIPVEKLASDKIQEPVTIGSMHAALWPTPHFVLEGVAVGSAPEIKIGAIRVLPVLGTLFEDSKTLHGLEIDSLSVPQESLGKVLQWLEASRGTGKLQLGHVTLRNAAVRDLQLPAFDADIMLDAADRFTGATLKSTDGKLSAHITPRGDRLEADISAAAWRLPIGAALVFDDLHATAVASRKGIKIVELDGRIHGGTVTGSATLGWDGPWTVTGELALANASLSGITQVFTTDIALTGDLAMKASYSAKSNALSSLLDKPTIKAGFTCRDGSIGNVNLAHIMVQDARDSGENLTRFDKLSGSVDLVDGHYQFRQLKLIGRQLSADGDIAMAANKALSGSINADMAVQSRQFHARLRLTGNLKQPRLK